ncbi:hypothetical protein GJ496_000199 [Pomphorhynchus laevis]|nr:hypothetical protein GJ496_000199 [Pomphorhynchus laevis]
MHDSFENRFQDFVELVNVITLTNWFILSDEQIMNMPVSFQMKLVELKTNSLLKTIFEDFQLLRNNTKTIEFWQLLPQEEFSELRKFAQIYICEFGSTYRCDCFQISTQNKVKTHGFKFEELKSVTDLHPDIKKLAKLKQNQK